MFNYVAGPLTNTISHEGILAVYQKLNNSEKDVFKAAYCASYMPARDVSFTFVVVVACPGSTLSFI